MLEVLFPLENYIYNIYTSFLRLETYFYVDYPRENVLNQYSKILILGSYIY